MDAATSAAVGAAELDRSWSNGGGAVEGASSAGFERNASKSPIAVCLFNGCYEWLRVPGLCQIPICRHSSLCHAAEVYDLMQALRKKEAFPSFFQAFRSFRSCEYKKLR